MDSLNIHDAIHAGVYLAGMAVTVAVLKADMRWLRQWCREHKADDDKQFSELKQDVRDLRKVAR